MTHVNFNIAQFSACEIQKNSADKSAQQEVYQQQFAEFMCRPYAEVMVATLSEESESSRQNLFQLNAQVELFAKMLADSNLGQMFRECAPQNPEINNTHQTASTAA